MLRVRLRTCFKINQSKQTVFEAARIALISGADHFLNGFVTTLSHQTLCGDPCRETRRVKLRGSPPYYSPSPSHWSQMVYELNENVLTENLFFN
jgi:hypothetical protein